MSLLNKVSSGIKIKPQIMVLHGQPAVGKSTFASKFDACLFLDLEDGSANLNVTRLTASDLPTYSTVLGVIDELIADNKQFKTLVIDTATKLEAMIHRHLCGTKFESIEDYGGGFGRGYTASREELQKLMQKLRILATKMTIIINGHSSLKAFHDPVTNSTYDRFIMQNNEKFAQILMNEADSVFFLKHDVSTAKDSKTNKTQAFLSGERKIMTTFSPAYDAKTRLQLPSELPLSYEAFVKAVEENKPKSAAELRADIKAMLLKADDQNKTIATQKVTEAGDDITALIRIKQKLSEMVRAA
jgi:hypothetical protein